MQLPISSEVLSAPVLDHDWSDDWDDWEELLGLPEEDELARFAEMSWEDEQAVAAAMGEWIFARLGAHSGELQLNRDFLDALWWGRLAGADVDLERRSQAGTGNVDGALRLMRELTRTAADLEYSAPGVVRLARKVTAREHRAVLESWLTSLLESPPQSPHSALHERNPFRVVLAANASDDFDFPAYDQYLHDDSESGFRAFLSSLFPITHPRGIGRLELKQHWFEKRTLFVELNGWLFDRDGSLLEGAVVTLQVSMEPQGMSVQQAIAREHVSLRRRADETRDWLASFSNPRDINLLGFRW